MEEEEDVFDRMKSGHTVVKPEVHAFTSHSTRTSSTMNETSTTHAKCPPPYTVGAQKENG